MKIFFIILLLIIFLPLPLKSIIYYSNENYYIKLFNFKIVSKKNTTKNNPINAVNNDAKEPKKKKNKKNKKKHKKSLSLKKLPITKIIYTIDHNRFKPILISKGYINYSLPDAATTAITYGTLSAIMPFIYRLFSIIFKNKKFNINITPNFKDKFFIEVKINSIIFISLGQIIYICYLIIKLLLREKVRIYERTSY